MYYIFHIRYVIIYNKEEKGDYGDSGGKCVVELTPVSWDVWREVKAFTVSPASISRGHKLI
jgi:hypothetical protein